MEFNRDVREKKKILAPLTPFPSHPASGFGDSILHARIKSGHPSKSNLDRPFIVVSIHVSFIRQTSRALNKLPLASATAFVCVSGQE